MAEFVLYGCWRSSASDRLQIGLRCKALSFRYVPVDLDQSEQTSDSYLAINPRGEVPTLIVDGQAWFQTLSILVELEGAIPIRVSRSSPRLRMIPRIDACGVALQDRALAPPFVAAASWSRWGWGVQQRRRRFRGSSSRMVPCASRAG